MEPAVKSEASSLNSAPLNVWDHGTGDPLEEPAKQGSPMESHPATLMFPASTNRSASAVVERFTSPNVPEIVAPETWFPAGIVKLKVPMVMSYGAALPSKKLPS